ncbi:MAG: sulfotransferase [Phycisphaera sp.]|nr:sulfotransferase [Phycisphaera sp.]
MNGNPDTPPASETDLETPTVERALALLDAKRPIEADLVMRRLESTDSMEAAPPMLGLRLSQARRDPVRLAAAADEILKRTPRRPDLKLAKARASYAVGRLEPGLEQIRSIRLPPGHPQMNQIRWWHAKILIRSSRFDEAAAIDRVLLQHPAMRHAAEVQLGEIALLQGELREAGEKFSSVVEDDDSPVSARFDASFLLARTLDRINDPDGAFEAARLGNRLHEIEFDADAWNRSTDTLIERFDRKHLDASSRSGVGDETPVFLVGMPRSGTSLLEQILASHPRAGGVGERQDPFRIHENVVALGEIRADGEATTEDLELEARSYLRMHSALGADEDRIINKALGLDRVLGTMARVLPGSRVIHLRRNPRDTILSIHQQSINVSLYPWSTRLEDLITARDAHERLMAHWKRELPIPILTVSYEDLVAEPESQLERILSFLDLEPDEACLRFHESPRSVITPSHDQVRVPLNRQGIGRWRRYERHLGPVLDAYPVTADDPDADGAQP